MSAFKFDSINALEGFDNSAKQINEIIKQHSVPYEKYFGEMELTEEEKQERITTAREIELMMIFLFAYIAEMGRNASKYRDNIIAIFQARYADIIVRHLVPDEYTEMYIKKTTLEIVDTTLKHTGDQESSNNHFDGNFQGEQTPGNYFLSDDRARFIAENEANSILNYGDFKTAIFAGYTKKQWRTMEDKKVRETHNSINGIVTGINELFEVGNALMLFPRDTSHGAGAEEIVGCRCSLKYLK